MVSPKSRMLWSLKGAEVLRKGFYVWGIYSLIGNSQNPRLMDNEFYRYKYQAIERRKEIVFELTKNPINLYWSRLFDIKKIFVKDGIRNERKR